MVGSVVALMRHTRRLISHLLLRSDIRGSVFGRWRVELMKTATLNSLHIQNSNLGVSYRKAQSGEQW